MKNSHTCPKCGSRDIVRIPDHPSRYASGSNIYTTRYTLLGKVPVIRYVCCGCGYVENWVDSPMELVQIHQTYGAPCLFQRPGAKFPRPAFAEIHRKPVGIALRILPVLPSDGR